MTGLALNLGLSLGSQSTGGTPTPTPTPANFLVTNDSEFATANANATAGQIIQLQDSGTFTALTLTNATGVIVRGQTPHVPTLAKLTINQALGANVSGLKVQANSTPTGAPKLIDLLGNCNGLVVDNNIVRGGNPWNSFADFDPTITDTARMGSSGTGWSATAPYVSDLWYGIGSSGSGATLASGNITITNNVVTDVGCGIKWGVGDTMAGKLTINGNRVGRIYTDFISFLLAATSANITGWEICGNELFDAFSQPQDNGNPHSDAIQIAPVTTWPFPLINGLICGNILWQTPGGRGEAQRIFTNSFDVGYPWVAPVVVDNMMLSRVTSHGIDLTSSDGEGAAWAYVLRNILLANPTRNTLIQNEGSTNSVSGIGPSTISAANISVRNSANYGNPANYIALNTVEQITNFTNNQLSGNITTGLGTTAGAYATWLDTDTSPEWDALISADATLAGLTQKSAYAANRPMVPGETATAFRTRWSVPANRPWASLPSWVGWADLSGVVVSTLQTSEWAFVHAGNTTRSISITGGEYRIADDRSGTNATAWGSASGTVAHGKYLQVRQTSSASSSTSTTLSVTIGSTVLNWVVTTASAAAYPIVALDTATPDIWRISGASTLGSDGSLGTLALTNFKMASAPGTAEVVFTAASANARVRATALTTGKIRIGLYNTSGTIFANIDTTVAVCDGNYHDILVCWDTSDVSSSSGCDVYVDGSASKTATTWPASPTNVGYSGSITSYQFGAPASTRDFEIGAFYLNTVARVDLSNGTNRAKFSADQMGLNGTGPTGSSPIILLVGTAGQTGGWNDAAGINWSTTGSKFVKVGSASATDVSGSPWV